MSRTAWPLFALALTACTDLEEPFIAPIEPTIPEGEVCFPPEPELVRLRFEPTFVAVAPGRTRTARLVVDPDVCSPTAVTFASSNVNALAAPAEGTIDYASPTVDLELAGAAVGTSTLTAELALEGVVATASLDVHVLEATLTPCASGDDVAVAPLAGGAERSAAGTLAGASIALPAGADAPNAGSFLWSVTPFDASIACAADIVPPGYLALGPAVTFGPADASFARELPLSLPINPALLPDAARWRHLRFAYASPTFETPRAVPVADPRVSVADGVWRVGFRAPRLGTYQAIVKKDAGTHTRSRRITHRAIIGVSMGGAGTAQFGMRNHHLFDVIAPLGGPVDWTWLLDHLENNHLAGFRPIAPGTVLADIPLERSACDDDGDCAADERCLGAPTAGKCALLPPTDEPYEHASTFDTWWYEFPATGHGGGFERSEYVQIFRDLALMFGNPNGKNALALNLPAGVDPEHPAVTGGHPNGECKIWVDPIEGHPDEDLQSQLANACPLDRCANVQVLDDYFDDEFNPDGTFPVITFCDGSPQMEALSPYANTWSTRGNDYPMEVALAVDYDGDGVRDELEPVIRAGHERWDDWGEDGVASADEPGFGSARPDPGGDDYEPQYNPLGSERDHRRQEGEPFADDGLDGVPGTAGSPYDFGEGDASFTAAPGLQRFWDYDPHSVVRQWTDQSPSGPLDDDALARIDVWTDGGTRDLFNFLPSARHLTGTFAARDRDVAYFSEFNTLPGLDPAQPDVYNPAYIVWDDLQGVVLQRYGQDEPTPTDIDNGSGQHVGTVNEIARRLQSALYFIGSRWDDAPHAQTVISADDESPLQVEGCDVASLNCEFDFTSSFGRTGPVAVSVPPGYFHRQQEHVRYPVVYLLHGYGQTPEDLAAAVAFLRNWMNGATDSQYSRLASTIVVYVDGRCRVQNGTAECIRGTFFTDSIRPDGPQMEQWWLELMDYVDQNFRTMGETVVDQTD